MLQVKVEIGQPTRYKFHAIGLKFEAELCLDEDGEVQIDALYCDGQDADFLLHSWYDREIYEAAAGALSC